MRNGVVAVVLVILVAGSLVAGYFAGSSVRSTVTSTSTSVEVSNSTTTETVTSYTLSYCIVTGTPGPIYVRFLNSSTMAPVAGVYVVAVTTVWYCSNSSSTASRTVSVFTTNGTEWYQLPTVNHPVYSIAAFYSGHMYNFTAESGPMSTACATLYIPSGQTNATIISASGLCVA